MKIASLLGFVLAVSLARAAAPTATITEATKLEVTRGKGTVVLKAGTVVEVVSKDGEMLGVVYRSITGSVPAAKTDFKGEAPAATSLPAPLEAGAKSNSIVKSAPPAVALPPASTKPLEAKPASPLKTDNPASTYGKMVKKAEDSAAKHQENLVEPVDATTAKKN